MDFPNFSNEKIALFHVFSAQLGRDEQSEERQDSYLSSADICLARTDFLTRQCFLLVNLEEFSAEDAALILKIDASEVIRQLDSAVRQMSTIPHARILIIEDEPLIALHLQAVVDTLGHTVIGIARTHGKAVEIAQSTPPDLILADIRLADETSGVDAAVDIVKRVHVPVIFITAYPHRVLTGARPEPTFLIRKPFSENQVRATIVQALLFHAPVTTLAMLLFAVSVGVVAAIAFALWHTIEPQSGALQAWWWIVIYLLGVQIVTGILFFAARAQRRREQQQRLLQPAALKSQLLRDAVLGGMQSASQVKDVVRQHPRLAVAAMFAAGALLSRRTHWVSPLSRILLRIL